VPATVKVFLSGWNIYQFVPNLENKHLGRWITTTKHHLPDFRLVSSTLRLLVNTTAGQNTCSVLGKCERNVMQQAARVLALSTRGTIITTSVPFWLADVHHVVQIMTETTVFPIGCGFLIYRNLISVIPPSLQNFRHSYIDTKCRWKIKPQSLGILNISQTHAAIWR